MNRSPWHRRSFGSGADDGMEALQTDVMRFMAILGFCLVAIFALVQSLPFPRAAADMDAARPAPEPSAAPASASRGEPPWPPTMAPEVPAPFEPPAQTVRAEPREPVTASPAEPPIAMAPSREPERVAEPQPEAVREPRPDAPRPSDDAPKREGFSLRFASNDALRRLVTRGDVTLYAVAGGRAWRMAAARGRPSFSGAPPPRRFHEMARGSVPADLVRAVRRVGPVTSAELTWGVVLPDATTGAIRALVRDRAGGDLVIDSRGAVHLVDATGRLPLDAAGRLP